MVDQTRYAEQALREKTITYPVQRELNECTTIWRSMQKTMQNFILFSITFKS